MATLLYDADCGFCRWSAAKVIAWDRRAALRLVALQDRAQSERLLGAMSEDARMASWHLVIDGQVRSGGEAVPALLRRLPGGRPLAALAAALKPLTNLAYRLVARRRSLLGRLLSDGARRRADERLRARRLS